MLLAVFVVEQGLLADALLDRPARHRDLPVPPLAVEHDHFEGAQRDPRVPVGEGGDHPQQLVGEVDLLPAEAARVGEGAAQEGKELLLRKRLEDKDLAAGEQRRVDLEGGILGGRPDEHDAPALDEGQEGVLLGLVEAVDLVDEKDRPVAHPPPGFGARHDLLDLLDAAGHGGKIDEFRLGPVRDDPREGGFAHAGRPPEDHRGDPVALDELAQDLALAEQVPLPREFLEGFGAQAAGQRGLGLPAFKEGLLTHTITAFSLV